MTITITEPTPKERFGAARDKVRAGASKAAIAELSVFVTKNPNWPEGHNLLAQALLGADQAQKALDALDRAKGEDSPHRHILRSQCLLLLGRIEDNHRHLEAALTKFDADHRLVSALAHAREAVGDLAGAAELVDRLALMADVSAQTLMACARLRQRIGPPGHAIDIWSRAHGQAQGPYQIANAAQGLCRVLLQSKRYKQALEIWRNFPFMGDTQRALLKELALLDPAEADAFLPLDVAILELGKTPEDNQLYAYAIRQAVRTSDDILMGRIDDIVAQAPANLAAKRALPQDLGPPPKTYQTDDLRRHWALLKPPGQSREAWVEAALRNKAWAEQIFRKLLAFNGDLFAFRQDLDRYCKRPDLAPIDAALSEGRGCYIATMHAGYSIPLNVYLNTTRANYRVIATESSNRHQIGDVRIATETGKLATTRTMLHALKQGQLIGGAPDFVRSGTARDIPTQFGMAAISKTHPAVLYKARAPSFWAESYWAENRIRYDFHPLPCPVETESQAAFVARWSQAYVAHMFDCLTHRLPWPRTRNFL